MYTVYMSTFIFYTISSTKSLNRSYFPFVPDKTSQGDEITILSLNFFLIAKNKKINPLKSFQKHTNTNKQ